MSETDLAPKFPVCDEDGYAKILDSIEGGVGKGKVCQIVGQPWPVVRIWMQRHPRFGDAVRAAHGRHLAILESRASEIAERAKDEVDQRMAYRPEMLGKLRSYIEDCPDNAMTKHGLSVELGVCAQTVDKWRSMDVEGVAREIVRGADESFLDFWCEIQMVPDTILRRAFNQSAVGDMRDRVLVMLAQHHGGYVDQTKTTHDVGDTLSDIYARMSSRDRP